MFSQVESGDETVLVFLPSGEGKQIKVSNKGKLMHKTRKLIIIKKVGAYNKKTKQPD